MMEYMRSTSLLKASICCDISLDKVMRCWSRVLWSKSSTFDDMEDGVIWCSLACLKGWCVAQGKFTKKSPIADQHFSFREIGKIRVSGGQVVVSKVLLR